MRLAVSLALWLVTLCSALLALHGWFQLEREKQDLYSAVGRELTLVATAVRGATENAIRDGQVADVETLLEQLELKDPKFDLFVFTEGEEPFEGSWGDSENLVRARELARRDQTLTTLQLERLESGNIAVIAPLRETRGATGRIVILRSAEVLEADLQQERKAILLSIVMLVALISVAILAVLHFRLQRPITRIVGAVHRVARGDLSTRVRLDGSDELALLAHEFDAMVEALESARAQLTREAETREHLDAEMLHANRLAIVGQLAATLAHEVGSPLQVLGGRARDIVARADVQPEVQRSASIIVEQAERLHHIVDRFLDVARRKAPVVQSVKLEAAVQQVIELLAPHIRRSRVRVDAQVPADLVVRADQAQLQQVLLNLLQNALRASPEEGTVRVEALNSTFERVPGRPPTPSIALSVEDEGEGLPDDERESVFEPFITLWNSELSGPSGTGLGLSVVRTIMNDHGGVIYVEQREGRGARFIAHFPRQDDAAVAQEEERT